MTPSHRDDIKQWETAERVPNELPGVCIRLIETSHDELVRREEEEARLSLNGTGTEVMAMLSQRRLRND